MSAPTDPPPGGLFESDDLARDLGLAPKPAAPAKPASIADAFAAHSAEKKAPAADPDPPEPTGPGPGGGSGNGFAVLGTVGSVFGMILLVIVVRGIKTVAVQAVREADAPAAKTAPPPTMSPEVREHFAKLFAGQRPPPATGPNRPAPAAVDPVEPDTPIAPPPWTPTPVGKSPFDKFRPADLPAAVRRPDAPKELVAAFNPDPKRDWANELGVWAVTGRGRVLDARPLPGRPGTTRFVVQSGRRLTVSDLADGTVAEVMRLSVTGDQIARLSIPGDRLLLCDGEVVRRVPVPDGGDGVTLDALSGPPSPYVQMELFDGDRMLILRQEDGRLRGAQLARLAVTNVVESGRSADDLAASPDRQVVAEVSRAKRTILFSRAVGEAIDERTLTIPVVPVKAAVHPGLNFAAVLDAGNTTRVFDLKTGHGFGSFSAKNPPRALEFAPDGRHLLAHDPSGGVYVFRFDQMAGGPPPK